MKFEFATAGRILFGAGSISEAPAIAASMGRRVFVVTGSSADRAAGLVAGLKEQGCEAATFAVAGEPTTDVALAGAEAARGFGCDVVVAMGGGSVLDAGKAIAALATNQRDLFDYLEVIGRGQPLTEPPTPCIAIPTTAGTGAEVTRNAVLGSPEHRVKVSLRHPLMLPRVAIVDPRLTRSVPPLVTATTGLDALTQLLEAFVTPAANPMTDGVCREGLARAGRSLRRAWEDGSDDGAREDMAVASLFGGLALANARLGAVHGFAGPLGGMFPAPHGAVCARLLPLVIEANARALDARDAGSPSLERLDEAACLITGRQGATAGDLVEWTTELVDRMQIPPLSSFGVRASDIPSVVEKARRASSMKGNPVDLTVDELSGILARAL